MTERHRSAFDRNLDRDHYRAQRGMAATAAGEVFSDVTHDRSGELMDEVFALIDDGGLTADIAMARWCQLREIHRILEKLGILARSGRKAQNRNNARVVSNPPAA